MIDVAKYSDEEGVILPSVAEALRELEEHHGWTIVKDFCEFLSDANLRDSRNVSASILSSKISPQKLIYNRFYRDGISEGMDLMTKFPGKMLETYANRVKIREALEGVAKLEESENSDG